jgi:hypothetical protein
MIKVTLWWKYLNLLHCSNVSSEPSSQSLIPSHTNVPSTHLPDLHWNSEDLKVNTQICYAEMSNKRDYLGVYTHSCVPTTDKNTLLHENSDYVPLYPEHVQERLLLTEISHITITAHKMTHNEKTVSIHTSSSCVSSLKLLMHFSVIWYWVFTGFDFC